MLFRELEAEKFWQIPGTNKNEKKKKLENALNIYNYGATVKKDGEYIRAIYDTDGEVWILGRGTNAKTVKNLDKHLVFITEWLKKNFKRGTCLLGELYVEGKTSRAIRAYTGSLVPKSLTNQKNCPPNYYVFDAWAIDGTSLLDTPYSERIAAINEKMCSLVTPQIDYVELTTGKENILNLIGESLAKDEEGVVIVQLDSKPNPGKRTAWKTIKIKKELSDDIDCFFTGRSMQPTRLYSGKDLDTWQYWENLKTGQKMFGQFVKAYFEGDPIEPVTRLFYNGWAGSLEVGVFNSKKEIVSLCYVSGITDQLREQHSQNPQSISMKPIIITGMETTDGSIRHPKFISFREDIDISECTYEKIFGGM